MVATNILEDIKDTYSDSKYINVVGTESDMMQFIQKCQQNHIWFYRVCTLFVYKKEHFKIVFLKKKDQKTIEQLIKHKKLVLNASNPF